MIFECKLYTNLSYTIFISVRQKCKEMIDFIQDDDRLRDERKKSKKNKDKYVGLSSENGSHRYSMSTFFIPCCPF